MRFGLASRLGIVLALSGMLSAGITAFQAQRASETLRRHLHAGSR